MNIYMIGIKNRGFTLIELLVSMSVLLIISAVSTSLFVSVFLAQKKMFSAQELSGQLSYALEYMSKSLRMAGRDMIGTVGSGGCLGEEYKGYNYALTRLEDGNYSGIKFVNKSDNDTCTEFYLDKTNPLNPIIKEIKNSGEPIALTSEKTQINSFYFVINGTKNISGSSESDNTQPRVTIFLDASLPDSQSRPIKIQTTISQRNINIK